jgi:hypothetical protein
MLTELHNTISIILVIPDIAEQLINTIQKSICFEPLYHLPNIPIVREFLDMFPDDLPGLPPDRDVEFVIELKPGTAPVSRRAYRMPLKELVELKIQLQELLDKGYVKSSSSPWGCPAIFMKKKDKTLRLCVDYQR